MDDKTIIGVLKEIRQRCDSKNSMRECAECEFYSKSNERCAFEDLPQHWKIRDPKNIFFN